MTQQNVLQNTNVQESQTRPTQSRWTYRPNVDVFELSDEIQLLADLPGADPETIDVSLEGDTLTIHAPVTSRQTDQRNTLHDEYGVGDFHRQFEIHEQIEADAISAAFENGTLIVHLPKQAKAQRRKITIAS